MARKKIDLNKLEAATESAAMTDNADRLTEASATQPEKKSKSRGGRKKVDPAKKLLPIATLNGTAEEKERMETWARNNGFTSLSQILRMLCSREGII